MIRVLGALLGLLLAGSAAAQTTVELRNPPAAVAAGAPADAHYFTTQAEAGLSAETVPSANAQTLLGHTFVQMLADIAAQAADADLTIYAGITPSPNTQTLLGGADFAAWRTNLSLTALATTAPGTGVATALGNNVSGSGSLCLTTSCVMVTPTLGVASATSVDIGSTDITLSRPSALLLSVEGGTAGIQTGGYNLGASSTNGNWNATVLAFRSDLVTEWSSTTSSASGTYDLVLRRGAAATLTLGAADAASPVAQNIAVQSVVTGTTDTAGANFTIKASQGTGTGASGSIILATASAGSTGSTPNALSGTVTFSGNGNEVLTGNITTGSASSVTFGSRSRFKSTADGTAMVRNNADSANSDFETKTVRTDCFAIGSLPTGAQGKHACVTDQLTTCAAAGTALTAGGSKVCPAFYDGAAWVGE